MSVPYGSKMHLPPTNKMHLPPTNYHLLATQQRPSLNQKCWENFLEKVREMDRKQRMTRWKEQKDNAEKRERR